MDVGRRGVVLLVGFALAFPPTALAQQTIAPPGKSGADQYFETIPSAKGNVAPPGGGGSAGGSGGSGSSGIRSLARLGKDGRSAAALAAATAPRSTAHDAGQSTPAANGRSPMSSFTKLIGGTDTGGIGIVLPILLAAILALAIALALVKVRRRCDPV
jgi:hypothetical protein